MRTLSTRFVCLVVGAAATFSPLPVRSQAVLLVDIKTVSVRGTLPNDSPLQPRLFLDSAATQPAPLESPVWFVADLNHDGLPFQNLGRTDILKSEMLGPDDFVLRFDAVDGDQPGRVAGAFRRNGVGLDMPAGRATDAVLGGNVYVLLWNDSASATEPAVGTSFGYLDLGVNAKPAIGNPFWAIDRNLAGTPFTIVPEPTVAAGGAFALSAWAAWRFSRRRAKARVSP